MKLVVNVLARIHAPLVNSVRLVELRESDKNRDVYMCTLYMYVQRTKHCAAEGGVCTHVHV